MKRITFTLKKSLLLTLVVILFASCASVDKMMDEGRYDELISLAKRKISGKKKKNAKYVAAAEEAFNRANQRDLAHINELEKVGNLRAWDNIFEIANGIAHRQNKIASLLPLVDKHGYEANFAMVETYPIIENAGLQASNILYLLGKGSLAKAKELEDKHYARNAFRHFEDIAKYRDDYRDILDLKNEAYRLGVSRILITMQNESNLVIPRHYEEELLALNFNRVNDFWRQYYTETPKNEQIDYSVVFYLRNIEVSPEYVRESSKEYNREVQDGWEYILDENGNVAKDTSGNDLRQDKFINVRARILEVAQEKRSELSGKIAIYSIKDERLIDSHNVQVFAEFTNSARRVQGDRRALQGVSWNAGETLPFPTNEEMIFRTADKVKPLIISRIKRN